MRSADRDSGSKLDIVMQKVSLLVSLLALALMVYGFVDFLVGNPHVKLPGSVVLPLNLLLRIPPTELSLTLMSIGIVLLSALPAVRVLLALWLYFRSHQLLNTLVALLVFLELLLSAHFGG